MKKNMQWFVHELMNRFVTPDVHALDMTMGNGHDTYYLAQRASKVSAFDVQEEALKQTQSRLQTIPHDHVSLHLASHDTFTQYVTTPFHFVVFNLGYLPGSDKRCITQPKTTLQALERAYHHLEPNGVIVVTLYKKHQGALDETKAVYAFLETLNQARISRYHFLTDDIAPEVVLIEKLPL